MRRQKFLAFLLIFLNVGCGVAGAKYSLGAPEAKFPISFSDALFSSDGRVVVLGDSLEPRHSFELSFTPTSFFYGTTQSAVDLSETLNSIIDEHHGDGIVQLFVQAENCKSNALPFITMLPIFPGCQNLKVTGVVVKLKR